jgi:AraC-like DNA-binding protein
VSRPLDCPDDPIVVATFPMPVGTVFNWHTHEDHQLAWAVSGVLTVLTEDATWVLPPTRALWIPAGLPHQAEASGQATMRSLYVRPDVRVPALAGRTTPAVVGASQLLAELIGYLGTPGLADGPRTHAETLLADLLTPIPVTAISVRPPADGPARSVAEGLRRDPADKRTLAEWGHQVGASERTLARAFVAGTGMSFGRWRTLARMQAALPMLAAGDAAGRVAVRVGYETPSAFTAAFRREIGVTPAAYFRDASAGGQA